MFLASFFLLPLFLLFNTSFIINRDLFFLSIGWECFYYFLFCHGVFFLGLGQVGNLGFFYVVTSGLIVFFSFSLLAPLIITGIFCFFVWMSGCTYLCAVEIDPGLVFCRLDDVGRIYRRVVDRYMRKLGI